MVNPDTDRTSALHILENGPHAPRCPRGHGPLTAGPDDQAPTGVALSCPTCGHRRDTEVSMLNTLLNPGTARFDTPLRTDPTPPRPEVDPAEITAEIAAIQTDAREPLGKTAPETTRDSLDPDHFDFPDELPPPPRGQRPDGTIRTTGWLQLGRHPISSGIWAALAGAAPGLALVDLAAWLPLALPALTCTAWYATTRWLRPASPAINRERLRADELLPGDPVRLHGPIGPVGIVEQVTPDTEQHVRVRFTGGTHRVLPADARCHLVHLRA
ncbi:hypothetical protein ABT337_11150 [Saccharopolyspora hirsuta]|uniref:Uncharacterized protein n=1 Tax=Saccharopolyspora hirsuta TaxID=1837 RepID=A0A5M7BX42_SACHI|nr:hypothetical protein [Saccharopolyspora hirsuta]KAA5834339.1 hypothetical protein F1721_11670 [Saccharopolyspora hirsuta]